MNKKVDCDGLDVLNMLYGIQLTQLTYKMAVTRSSAVAKRPRDASFLVVVVSGMLLTIA